MPVHIRIMLITGSSSLQGHVNYLPYILFLTPILGLTRTGLKITVMMEMMSTILADGYTHVQQALGHFQPITRLFFIISFRSERT